MIQVKFQIVKIGTKGKILIFFFPTNELITIITKLVKNEQSQYLSHTMMPVRLK